MKTLNELKVPGFAWSVLLIGVSALLGSNFDKDALVYQVALVLLTGLAKGVALGFTDKPEPLPTLTQINGSTPASAPRSLAPEEEFLEEPQQSMMTRWMIG